MLALSVALVACDNPVVDNTDPQIISIYTNATTKESVTEISLQETQTATLFVQGIKEGQTAAWTSNKGSIASVDNGVVTALSAGTAVITVQVADGITASVQVTVTALPPRQSISIYSDVESKVNISEASIRQGETVQLYVKGIKEGQTATWTSATQANATVNEGLVTGVAVGQSIITVQVDEGVTASVTVTVTEPIYMAGLTKSELDAIPCVPASEFDNAMNSTWNIGWDAVVTAESTAAKFDFTGTNTTTPMWRYKALNEGVLIANGDWCAAVSTLVGVSAPSESSDVVLYNKIDLTGRGANEFRIWGVSTKDGWKSGQGSFKVTALYKNGAGYESVVLPLVNLPADSENLFINEDGFIQFKNASGFNIPDLTDGCMFVFDSTVLEDKGEVILLIEIEGVGDILGDEYTEAAEGALVGEVMQEFFAVKRIMFLHNPQVITMYENQDTKQAITTLNVRIDGSAQLYINGLKENQTPVWASSNEAVATVVDGLITPVAPGETTITVSVSEEATATLTLTVKPMPAPLYIYTDTTTEEELATLDVVKEATKQLYVKGTDASITWVSSDEAVATVVDGLVTALTEGTTTISASISPEESCSIVITVVKPFAYNGFSASDLDAIPCVSAADFTTAMNESWNIGWHDASIAGTAAKFDFEGTNTTSAMWRYTALNSGVVFQNAGWGIMGITLAGSTPTEGPDAVMYNKIDLTGASFTQFRLWVGGNSAPWMGGQGSFRVTAVYNEDGLYKTTVLNPINVVNTANVEVTADGYVHFIGATDWGCPDVADGMVIYDPSALAGKGEVVIMIELDGVGGCYGTEATAAVDGAPVGVLMQDVVMIKRIIFC